MFVLVVTVVIIQALVMTLVAGFQLCKYMQKRQADSAPDDPELDRCCWSAGGCEDVPEDGVSVHD